MSAVPLLGAVRVQPRPYPRMFAARSGVRSDRGRPLTPGRAQRWPWWCPERVGPTGPPPWRPWVGSIRGGTAWGASGPVAGPSSDRGAGPSGRTPLGVTRPPGVGLPDRGCFFAMVILLSRIGPGSWPGGCSASSPRTRRQLRAGCRGRGGAASPSGKPAGAGGSSTGHARDPTPAQPRSPRNSGSRDVPSGRPRRSISRTRGSGAGEVGRALLEEGARALLGVLRLAMTSMPSSSSRWKASASLQLEGGDDRGLDVPHGERSVGGDAVGDLERRRPGPRRRAVRWPTSPTS